MPAAGAGAQAGKTRGRDVLIVDDDARTRDTVAICLRLNGWNVTTAATGAQALAEFDQGAFDAVLLDYHLPDMTGLECLRECRRRGGAIMAVAIFTADWDVEDEAADIRAMDAMLASKLCEAEELERLVSSLCALHGRFGRGGESPA